MEGEPPIKRSSIPYSNIIWGIIASLIASIFFSIFSQPTLGVLNLIINSAISPFYHQFIDTQYEQAAMSPGLAVSYGIFSSITLFSIIFILFGGTFCLIMIAELEQRISGKDMMNSGIFIFHRKISRFISYKFIKYVVIFTIPFGVLSAIISQSSMYTSIQAYSTYDTRLRTLTPVMSDIEYRNLVGKWANVRSKADYLDILKNTDEIAKKYGISLKKPLI